MLLVGATAVATPGSVMATGCVADSHCYSKVLETSDDPYTGVRDTRWIVDVDNPSDTAPIYATMWLIFENAPCFIDKACWIELGTEYRNGTTKNFGYLCVYGYCNFLFHITVYTEVGSHTWKIDRNEGDHNSFNEYIDGHLAYTKTGLPYTNGVRVQAGLESYNMNVTVPTHAYYNLKYKKGDNAYQNWAGEDDQGSIEYPMCGEWHLPTSWWGGEYDTCT
jgi:hypothetical protein